MVVSPRDFIRNKIDQDLEQGRHEKIVTRFPPEPNGFLHLGHAKSICLNFGIAQEYADAVCYMRFDDTNPSKENQVYIDAILDDVRWLGYDWQDRLTHASDYFQLLYDYAEKLIIGGKAYVDSLSAEEMREYRGTLTEAGKPSPHRVRSVEENLALIRAMRAGECKEGEHVVRAKIDMASPNLNMRDPVMYRIMYAHHPKTGDDWCIYPLYDFAHGLSDAQEGVTHSLCTLEFEDHRPLYDWFIDNVNTPSKPQQTEFSRLNLTHSILSKRILNQLVEENHVQGWDDPRMPTLAAMRRRGYPPEAIRDFCQRIGITKSDSIVEYELLETCVRENLDPRSLRVLAVVDPLKVIITNYDEDEEWFEVANHPQDSTLGSRQVPFSRELYIERDDFMEVPVRKYFRLSPGKEVRLKYAYYITCTNVIKNDAGEITELHATYDPQSRGGGTPDGRKVKGTIHWVSAKHGLDGEVRYFDRLFLEPNPAPLLGENSLQDLINPDAMQTFSKAKLEPSIANAKRDQPLQFERMGYFCKDSKDNSNAKPVLNRIVALRDTWAKLLAKSR